MNVNLKEFQSKGRICHEDPYRATGRTFRMLLRAILNASEGNSTILVFNTFELARGGKSKITRMTAHGVGSTFFESINPTHIKFSNGACIGFATEKNLENVVHHVKDNTETPMAYDEWEPTIYHDHYQGM